MQVVRVSREQQGEPIASSSASAPSADATARILVVDDVADVRHLIAHVLKRKGFAVTEAIHGLDAVAWLARQPFDLVISDLKMPEMGGLELLAHVRAQHAETDLILLTAYGTIQSAVQAMKDGAFDYVTKPFDIRDLEDKVARCLEARAQRAQAASSPIAPLIELNKLLSNPMELSDTLDAIIDLIQRTFRPAVTEVSLMDETLPQGAVMVRRGEAGLTLADAPLTSDMVRALAQQDEPWLLARQPEDGDPRHNGHHVSLLTVPLMRGEDVAGTLALGRAAGQPPFTRDDAQLLHVFGTQIALSMLHVRMRQRVLDSFRHLSQASLPAVQTLVEALRTFDAYTQAHSERVSRYARLLSQAHGLSAEQTEILGVAGLLHDLGKLGVSDNTLHKNGGLTDDEYDRVRLHPIMGAKILAGVEALSQVLPLVRHHHETMDGKGYPDGLAGEEIPLGARVLAVVDAYDSMTSDRPYRTAMSQEEAVRRLRAAAGTQWDANLVATWVGLVESQALGAL